MMFQNSFIMKYLSFFFCITKAAARKDCRRLPKCLITQFLPPKIVLIIYRIHLLSAPFRVINTLPQGATCEDIRKEGTAHVHAEGFKPYRPKILHRQRSRMLRRHASVEEYQALLAHHQRRIRQHFDLHHLPHAS